jgi:FkbH-like protein
MAFTEFLRKSALGFGAKRFGRQAQKKEKAESSEQLLKFAEDANPRKNGSMLAPSDLEISDEGPKNVLLIGACFLFEWADILRNRGYTDLSLERILFHYAARLPAAPPRPLENYDLQLVQVPLPTIMPESEYMRLGAHDPAQYEDLFERSVQKLDLFLKEALVWSDRVPAFVMTYLSPQQNLLGRLFPRYDIRNPIYFTEKLNMALDGLLKKHKGAYLLDTNQIASVYGRRFFQEDAYWHQFHGGTIHPWADEFFDADKRIERSPTIAQVHGAEVDQFVEMIWLEARAAYRTLKRIDEIKMLCVDLDDTLWRGVIGEMDEAAVVDNHIAIVSGWPKGLVEVLQFLRRRGIILAIVSKNDEAHVRSLWSKIFPADWIELEDFAIVKINWRPKAENVAEAMAEANILAKNVAFLDDNPVERAAVKAAFPDIRTIETTHYLWGRVLGWSPELQVANITEESSRRTEMIQAQVKREHARTALSREEFLASLDLRIAVNPVRATTDHRFPRAFELINKTNQFNTTGVRWSESNARDYFKAGGSWWTFEVADRYTHYGLVGVVCITADRVDQFVMSCRVFGLDVELAAFKIILDECAAPGTKFEGAVLSTENNAMARDIFQRIGWDEADGYWRGDAPPVRAPHVAVLQTL